MKMILSDQCEMREIIPLPRGYNLMCPVHGRSVQVIRWEIDDPKFEGYRRLPTETRIEPIPILDLSENLWSMVWAPVDFSERIFVSTTTHMVKQYAMPQWMERMKRLTYPNHAISICDTTKFVGTPHQLIATGMEQLRQTFLKSTCARWLHVECDVIVPPAIIENLLRVARDASILNFVHPFNERNHPGETDWLSVPIPDRKTDSILYLSMGCVMWSRALMEQNSFEDAPAHNYTDGWFIDKLRSQQKWNILSYPPGLIYIRHLIDPSGYEPDWS